MKDIGVIGLGVMGRSLALNLADHEFKVVGYNRTKEVTEEVVKMNHPNFYPAYSLKDLISDLKKPRKIMIMVKAGEAVDKVLNDLGEYLEDGDIVMDGGNSFFKETQRREAEWKEKGIYYYGVGISGGEQGARFGPSLMPGGELGTYPQIKPILESISAKFEGEPCCSYIGPNGAGHYVKMVHNGIEYADMQLIVEAYLLLKKVGNFKNKQLSEIFNSWNQGKTKSYLIEITSKILSEKDDETGMDLIDLIKDAAKQKGTGKWTVLESINQDMNASLILTAYQARGISNDESRVILQKSLSKPLGRKVDAIVFAKEVHKAYLAGKIIAYTQGFSLYKDASDRYGWNLKLEEIASIFRSGCIIQSSLLEDIRKGYQDSPSSNNLLTHSIFIERLQETLQSLRVVTSLGILHGVPLPTLTGAITYAEQLRSDSLGANLIQAQRDFFGAHMFERKDKEGEFHHEWDS